MPRGGSVGILETKGGETKSRLQWCLSHGVKAGTVKYWMITDGSTFFEALEKTVARTEAKRAGLPISKFTRPRKKESGFHEAVDKEVAEICLSCPKRECEFGMCDRFKRMSTERRETRG